MQNWQIQHPILQNYPVKTSQVTASQKIQLEEYFERYKKQIFDQISETDLHNITHLKNLPSELNYHGLKPVESQELKANALIFTELTPWFPRFNIFNPSTNILIEAL